MSPTGALANINTVVVAMMENRSFDHLLGFMSHEWYGRRTDVNGLHLPGPNFDWDNPDQAGRPFPPTATPDGYLTCDLPHGRDLVAEQINGGAMDGFIKAYLDWEHNVDTSPAPMRFCRPEDIPITAALAQASRVCDQWFSTIPDDTMPNRLMALSGYTLIDSTANIKPPFHLLPDQRTVFDYLDGKGKKFEIYVDAEAIDDVGPPSNLLLMKSQWKYLPFHAHTLDALEGRWRSNDPAPDVIYCEPFYNDFAIALGMHGNCNHPPLPVAYGEDFLKRLYSALTSNPAKWAHTMLVICYDEHGGFFDHVAPPPLRTVPPPGNTWLDPRPFETLGVRVPGIVVSPWVEPQTCFSERLDHTSILQLMVDRFGEPADLATLGDTAGRKAQGIVSLAGVLNAKSPHLGPITLGDPPTISGGATSPPISEIGQMFRGVMADKPARNP
jgi:phospholipase C